MGKITRKRRQFEIRRKNERREKLRKLKERYLASKNPQEREQIATKIHKIAPFYPLPAR